MNPGKVDEPDTLREQVQTALAAAGAAPAGWRETTEQDVGLSQTRELLAEGIDLLLCSGGDGTVRACAQGLHGTDVALGILPSGTGNLLARNLGIPADLDAAIDVALHGERRAYDVGVCGDEVFAVMAGLGIDAAMVGEAPEGLKGRIGWLAYAVSGLRAAARAPVLRVELELDGGRCVRSRGVGVLVANVGTLTGGMLLLPGADPADGRLDVAVLRPTRWRDWAALAAHVVVRYDRRRPHVERWTATTVRVRTDRAVAAEVDGDVRPATRELELRVAASSLLVCVPRSEP